VSVEGGTTLKVTDESLAQAARVIRDGGLVVIPTDTVYGVACDPRNKAAIDRIYRLKRRPRYKALQVLLASTDQLDELGLDLPSPLNRLSAAFLPGAFSPIAVARPDCTLETLADTADGRPGTQGIRIPNSALCLAILKATGPLAASSANRSGDERPSRRRLTRSAAKSTCIWTAVPPKAMSPAPSSKPIRTRATASRSCVKASSPKT
jgi:L-threonylcarbamoyladenylate synthase